VEDVEGIPDSVLWPDPGLKSLAHGLMQPLPFSNSYFIDRLDIKAAQFAEAYGASAVKLQSILLREHPVTERTVAQLHESADRLLALAAKLESFGEDVYSDGTVVRFKRTFSRTGAKKFTYAALRVTVDGEACWFLTGSTAGTSASLSWSELVTKWLQYATGVKVSQGWSKIRAAQYSEVDDD